MNDYVFYPPQEVGHIDKALYFGGVLFETHNWLRAAAEQLLPIVEKGVALFLPKKPFGHDEYCASFPLRMKWGQEYLAQAAEKGAVALWIPRQSVFYPHAENNQLVEQPRYAHNALVELQEAFIRHRHYGMPLTLGVDSQSIHYAAIKERFERFCPDVHIADSLEETCEQAALLSQKI